MGVFFWHVKFLAKSWFFLFFRPKTPNPAQGGVQGVDHLLAFIRIDTPEAPFLPGVCMRMNGRVQGAAVVAEVEVHGV